MRTSLSFLLLLVTTGLLPRFSNGFAGLESLLHHHAPPMTFIQTHQNHHPELISVIQHQLQGIQHAYRESLHEHPLLTKMLTGGTLAASGDAIAQRQSEEPYDKRRAASFLAFDMAYRALQHNLFPLIVAHCHGQFLSQLLPHHLLTVPTEYLAAMEQTLASQLGIVPFLYYPVFFTLTGFLQGLTFSASWTRAQDNFPSLMKRNLIFWIPVQFVQFGFLPEDLQIPFLSAAGLCWTFLLSMAAGSAKSYSAPPDPPTVTVGDVSDTATVTSMTNGEDDCVAVSGGGDPQVTAAVA